MPRASLALAALLLLAASLRAADPPPLPPPPAALDVTLDAHLANARDALVVAQEQLRRADTAKPDPAATPDLWGDYRRLTLELVNTALVEVDAGLHLLREEAERKAKEAQEKAKASKRKRR